MRVGGVGFHRPLILKSMLCIESDSCIPLGYDYVKCRKIMEVTLGTPDVKSRPMRCQKGLQLQLMCCTPFGLLSQDFGMRRMEDQRLEDWSKGQSCSQNRTLEDEN